MNVELLKALKLFSESEGLTLYSPHGFQCKPASRGEGGEVGYRSSQLTSVTEATPDKITLHEQHICSLQ